MDTYNGMPYCQVMLMNDDKSLCLNIGFLGYTYDNVEKYMTKTYVESDRPYAQKWTQMKYVSLDAKGDEA